MSNKTKRLAKGLGASALAVATIASGLSLGAASAAAVPSHVIDALPMPAVIQPTWKIDDRYYFPTPGGGDWSHVRFYGEAVTLDAAALSAPKLRVLPQNDEWALLQNIDDTQYCLWAVEHRDFNGEVIAHGECNSPVDQNLWKLQGGRLVNKAFPQAHTGAPRTIWTGINQHSRLQYTSEGSDGYVDPLNRLSADVTSVDVEARTAKLSGHAEPNASVIVTWGDGATDKIRASASGEWTYELDGLQLGTNPVHLEQYVDQQKTGEFDLDVELKIADLTVEHRFGAELEDLVTLSGTAQPGAIVKALDDAGNMIIASDQVGGSGRWAMELPAPNEAGERDIEVLQSYGGEDTGGTAVSIDYGKQLVVTRPEDGFQHPGGQLSATGLGEPGSVVTLHEGSKLLGSGTVLQSSRWNLTTTDDLDASEHTLTVTQKSKGGNVQTETVVVNPGEGAVEFTADGRFDAADPTKPAEAFGSAPKGSTIVLRNSVGQEIGRTLASGDAYVIPIDPMKATSGTNTFSVIIEGAPESDAKSFTLNYGQPAAAVVVTKPAKNGTVEPGRIAFAGTGETGSKIVVRGSSRVVASGTVTAGAWSATSTVDLQKGSYDLYFDQIAKGGLTSTVRHAFTIGETAPIVTPHTVTSPAAGAVVDTLTPEFRGTGHEGATITVRGSSRVVATGTVQNGQWAAKTDPDAPLTPGTYNLYVVQSVRGTVTGTVRVAFTVSNEAFRELSLSAPAQGETVTVLRPTFVGTATPGAEITVASSRRTVATATVDEFGTFRATALFDLERGGSYPGLEVKQVTKTGKSSTTAAFFTVDRNAQ